MTSLALGFFGIMEAAASPPRSGTDPHVRVERRAYLMGTQATLVTQVPDRTWGLRVLGEILERLEAVEAELSTWRPGSRLSAINRQPEAVAVPHPAPLCDLLEELAVWRDETDGAFDPAVGHLLNAWDLRGGGRRPAARLLEQARRNSGLEHLEIRRHPCRVTRTRDVLLDAGAFGKGAALELAMRDVSGPPVSPWLIDLGGQVAVAGTAEAPWPVALAHPQRRDQAALHLALAEGSLATSGGSERDVRLDEATLGHIVDPRTGEPVSRPGSVTVWHHRALIADVLSTALQVMGPAAGLAWAEERGLAACFLQPIAPRRGRGSDPTGLEAVTVQATTAFQRLFPQAGAAERLPTPAGRTRDRPHPHRESLALALHAVRDVPLSE